MKNIKTINILSGLIILILIVSVGVSTCKMSVAFGYGFAMGMESVEESHKGLQSTMPIHVAFSPTKTSILTPPDSISDNNGGYYPMMPTEGVVLVPTSPFRETLNVIEGILAIFTLIAMICVIVVFLKFIISMNKRSEFVLQDVKRLAYIGWLLIFAGICEIGYGIMDWVLVNNLHFDSSQFQIISSWSFSVSDLLFGLFALMLAGIWQRGLDMQTEQALTI